jgi:hypothetical protein
MNSTKWLTLTDFVKYLGREGKCKVDETPKGWFIALIHRDELEVGERQGGCSRARWVGRRRGRSRQAGRGWVGQGTAMWRQQGIASGDRVLVYQDRVLSCSNPLGGGLLGFMGWVTLLSHHLAPATRCL